MYKKVSILAAILLPVSLFAGFGGMKLPGVGKETKESSNTVEVDASQLQDSLVKDYLEASTNISMAQEKLLEAYGQKELAAKLKTLREEVLSADKPSKQDLKRQSEVTDEANEVIAQNLGQEAELDEAGKKLYQESVPHMVKGSVGIAKLSKSAGDFADNAKDEIKAAGMMGAAKVKQKLDVGLYVAPRVPKLVGNTMKTAKMLVSYGKKAKILDEDAEYEDALDAADGPQ